MPFKRKIPGLPLACNERSQTASGSHLVCVDLLPLLNALPHEKSDFGFFTKPIPLEEVSPSATKLPPGSCSFAKRAEVDNMGSLRQIFGEAIGGVAVVLAPRFPIALLPRR
jgi:hypothetical protein